MSELDPRSRFCTSDYQQTSQAINSSSDDSMDTNQVATNPSPNFIQDVQGGNLLLSQLRSRDLLHTAQSALSDQYTGWCSSDNLTACFAFPGQFQSWGNQLPPGSDDWSAISDYHFPYHPTQDGNSVRSLERPLHHFFGQPVENSKDPQLALPRQSIATENPTNQHGIAEGSGTYCQQCNMYFPSRARLEDHARETRHTPHHCRCGKPFSRLDVLRRHIRVSQRGVSFPCPHCKRHRGSRAFSRPDHLTQHLRGYHNMETGDESDDTSFPASPRKRKKPFKCSHETCSTSGGMVSLPDQQSPRMTMGRTFQTRGELTRHLREVHDESPFPCQELGCSRVGGKGFFREKDLLKHVEDHHTNVEFQPSAD